ncbi:MAG: ester cyclase [Maribacter sp.]
MGKLILLLIIITLSPGISCKDYKEQEKQDTQTIRTTTVATLKESSKNYLKAWNNNDSMMIKKIAIRNIIRNVNGEITSNNQKGLNKTMNFWHTALPDLKVVGNEIIIQGNRSYVSWTSKGTNTGMFGDMTPTGKKSKTEGFSVLTFDAEGQLIHENSFFNILGIMEDWGYALLPPNME